MTLDETVAHKLRPMEAESVQGGAGMTGGCVSVRRGARKRSALWFIKLPLLQNL